MPRAPVLWKSLCCASPWTVPRENSQAGASPLPRPEVDAARDKLKDRSLFGVVVQGWKWKGRDKAGAAKETKITWGKAEQREKIQKDMRRVSEGRKNQGVK